MPENNEEETGLTDIDWERRVLCSDGNCIGVIGPDGLCNECGKKYEGTLPEDHFLGKESLPQEESTVKQEDQSPEEVEPQDATEENGENESLENDDWQNRILCSDGNCIGVIGPDGCCKECGKRYEGDIE